MEEGTGRPGPDPTAILNPVEAAHTLFDLIGGRAAGRWLEIRCIRRKPGTAGILREWYSTDGRGLEQAADDMGRFAGYGDVFVGALPRLNHGGSGAADVEQSWVLWADCDNPESVERLAAFDPSPSLVVRSGSGGNVHAWWSLTTPVPAVWAQSANSRIAAALGADGRCIDPARILRVPGTRNWKHDPPSTVELLLATGERHGLSFVSKLPKVKAKPKALPPRERSGTDPLLGISAREYVPAIGGVHATPNVQGFAKCPLHDDYNPSCMCYEKPERGWHCFQCGEGGDIYRLASLVWGLPDRGRDFIELKRRLQPLFNV